MRLYLLTVVVWVVLALSTLWLVIQNESSLVAALVAWAGGIITYRLGEQTYYALKNRNTLV